MKAARVLLAMPFLALASSAHAVEKWGPTWSEVTGNLFPTAMMHRTAATVSKVDGKSFRDRIVKVTPGPHAIVMRSPTREGTAGSDKNLDINFEPCKRYYVNAQFKSKTGRAWEPVVAHTEKVTGCKIAP